MQFNLFDDEPEKAVVPTETRIRNRELTKAQKRFNSLIEKVGKLKDQLAQWQNSIPRVRARAADELAPLSNTYDKLRAEFVVLLDRAFDNKFFKKREKEKLQHLILSIAVELIDEDDTHTLKPLFEKHNGESFDELQDDQNAMVNAMMADMLGIDVPDDIDLTSEQQFHAFIHGEMERERQEEEAEMRKAEERRAKRKKSAKQLQREAKLQAEAQDMRKSIQEVYRKLAAELHPDREPDAAERERKTTLMQQVNVAYKNKDLLRLLELQIQAEQIDQTHLESIPDARLAHFNKILKEQCDELTMDLDELQAPFKMQLEWPPSAPLSADTVERFLENDIARMKKTIADLRNDLSVFKDQRQLREWLRPYRVPKHREMDDFDIPF